MLKTNVNLAGNTILVTGAAGFIGARLVAKLLSEVPECKVIGLDNVNDYYDVSLKFKGARDEQSIEMLDRIVNSRIFDFGYVYGGWGCVFWIQYLLEGASKDITSYYEKNFKPYNKSMEKVFKCFDEYTTASANP